MTFTIPIWALVLLVIFLIVRLPYNLWVYYLAVMNLKRVRDTEGLSPQAKWLGMGVLFEGYLKDVVLNVLLSVPLLEFPRELTVSARLKRLNVESSTKLGKWRAKVAKWVEPLLDPFDPSGDHI